MNMDGVSKGKEVEDYLKVTPLCSIMILAHYTCLMFSYAVRNPL